MIHFEYPEEATPIDSDEAQGLLLPHFTQLQRSTKRSPQDRRTPCRYQLCYYAQSTEVDEQPSYLTAILLSGGGGK
jgi:hypothetical protein